MATNLFKSMNAASMEPAASIRPLKPFGQLLQFPSGADDPHPPGGGRRDGLGCAVAVRLVLGFELLAVLSGYGIWRLLH